METFILLNGHVKVIAGQTGDGDRGGGRDGGRDGGNSTQDFDSGSCFGIEALCTMVKAKAKPGADKAEDEPGGATEAATWQHDIISKEARQHGN